jgi:hypothetical protein
MYFRSGQVSRHIIKVYFRMIRIAIERAALITTEEEALDRIYPRTIRLLRVSGVGSTLGENTVEGLARRRRNSLLLSPPFAFSDFSAPCTMQLIYLLFTNCLLDTPL